MWPFSPIMKGKISVKLIDFKIKSTIKDMYSMQIPSKRLVPEYEIEILIREAISEKEYITTTKSVLTITKTYPPFIGDEKSESFNHNIEEINQEQRSINNTSSKKTDKVTVPISKPEVEKKIEEPERKLRKWIGPRFNARSPVQVKNLMKVLGCANKHGVVESSDEAHLNAGAVLHPINAIVFNEILEIRGLKKLRDTYQIGRASCRERVSSPV